MILVLFRILQAMLERHSPWKTLTESELFHVTLFWIEEFEFIFFWVCCSYLTTWS